MKNKKLLSVVHILLIAAMVMGKGTIAHGEEIQKGQATILLQPRELGDVNEDGEVAAEDALCILQRVVKLIRKFPAELTMEPEQVFGYSEEELDWVYGGKYYENTMKKISETSMIWKPVRIDRQGAVQCSGYATALVFRYLGEDVTGKEIYDEIPYKFDDGTVAPEMLAEYIDEKENYRAQLYMGTIEDLKEAVAKGVPPIIFSYVSPKSSILHFIPVTGYDEGYIYLADSYKWDKENTTSYYNRKITYEDFETMWDIDIEYYSYLFIVVEKE